MATGHVTGGRVRCAGCSASINSKQLLRVSTGLAIRISKENRSIFGSSPPPPTPLLQLIEAMPFPATLGGGGGGGVGQDTTAHSQVRVNCTDKSKDIRRNGQQSDLMPSSQHTGYRDSLESVLVEFQTKVVRVFLLAIHNRLYSFALKFLFLQIHATSYNFQSSVTVHCKGERRKTQYCIQVLEKQPFLEMEFMKVQIR